MSRPALLAVLVVAMLGCKHEKEEAAPRGTPAPLPAPGDKAAPAAASEAPSVTPADLAAQLAAGDKPLLLHVGFRKLYEQAHIPGSEYLGPASDAPTLDRLRARVADLPKTTPIVVYCGCCPWDHCPNVEPALRVLRELGFTSVRALHIPTDFGTDWASHGYPVAAGA